MIHSLPFTFQIAEATLPSLFLVGSDDHIAWPWLVKHQYSNYGSTAPKVYADVTGAVHTSICNENHDLGEASAVKVALQCYVEGSTQACETLCHGLNATIVLTEYDVTH